MKKKKFRFPYVTIFIITLLISISYFAFFFQMPTGSATVMLMQYSGNLNSQWDGDWVNGGAVASNTALFGEYKIVQSISSRPNEEMYSNGVAEYACSPNSCGGTFLQYANKPLNYVGNLQCPIYRNPSFPSSESCCITRCRDIGRGFAPFDDSCSRTDYQGRECYCGTRTVYSQQDCGGYTATNSLGVPSSLGCYWKADIYKNNILINHFDWMKENKVLNLQGLNINLGQGSVFYASDCRHVNNQYFYSLPDNSFNFTVILPPNQVFQGQDVNVIVKVTNNYKPIKANLISEFKVETGLSNPSTEKREQYVDLNLGENSFSYTIPTKNVLNQLQYRITLDVLAQGNMFSGVNGNCYKPTVNLIKDLSSCQYVFLDSVSNDWTPIQINPNPLWLEKPSSGCPTGYIQSENTAYCIRSDIKDLRCMQIGCPVISGHNYQCTSAGLCAETVYVYKNCTNTACPEGMSCDTQTGACIDTHIFKEISQCFTSSDCYTPCSGMNVACENQVCKYSGECTKTSITCKDVGCGEGYTCNQDRAVCEKKTIIKVSDYTPLVLGGSLFLLAIIILLIIFFVKKKK